MSETNESQIYSGSQLFKPLAVYLGQPLDQLNLVVAQLFAFLFAIFFRNVLSHRKVSVAIRHSTSLLIGVIIGYFFIGQQIYHLLVLTTVSYITIMICPPNFVQKVVLIMALSHLSYLHLLRLLSYNSEYSLDVTSCFMIAVQRVINISFSLNDGLTKTDAELSSEQKRYAIRKKPSILEFFSYLFQFPTLLCGPLVFYNDYIEFINGQNFDRHIKSYTKLPSPLRTVLKKLFACILFAVLHVMFTPKFPTPLLRDDQFLYGTSLLSKMIFLVLQNSVYRFKYYSAFLMGELVCNASGLGFDGFTSDGRPVWDSMSNVDVFTFEFPLNIRTAVESWNKKTQIWFRRTAYDRNSHHKLFWAYLLSSVWHGFFPGYYLTFFSLAFFTVAARNVRRCLRPLFQANGTLVFTYNCLTVITTRVFMAYVVFPFYLQEFWASIQVYKQLYFFGHLLGLLAIFILPRLLPPKVRLSGKAKIHQE